MGMLTRAIAVSVATLWLAACVNNPPPAEPKKPPKKTQQMVVPDGAMDRGALEVVLREGPPWLLERVPVEEVMDKGKFVGWRVQELPIEWRNIDLKAGDVVTSVNAMPLQTPNDFWAAWTSLTVASELKVAYLREGEANEMSIPIIGTPSPTLAEDMKKRPKPPAAKREVPAANNPQYVPAKRKQTITIEGPKRPESDTNTDWSDQPF